MDRGFLSTMLLTGFLTAGAFIVYLYGLKTGTPEVARTYAFSLVFAELLHSFGVRSDVNPVWRIPFHKRYTRHSGFHLLRAPGMEPA